MESIALEPVQQQIDAFADQDVYFHLETSTGSYAALEDPSRIATCAFIRNGTVRFQRGQIRGEGPSYRVGLRLDNGWLYAEGLTDWQVTEEGTLLLGGYDAEGKLNVGLELSRVPLDCGS
ncbi:MAG: DUF1806 family protein [Nakamurella sp.]